MSDPRESDLQQVNTELDPDHDNSDSDDQGAAMQQMMGFSNFASLPKPQKHSKGSRQRTSLRTGANAQPVQPRPESLSNRTAMQSLPATSQNFTPASLPLPSQREVANQEPVNQNFSSQFQFSPGGGVDVPPIPRQPDQLQTMPSSSATHTAGHDASLNAPAHAGLDKVAYTHPSTGYSFTKRELLAYEQGVVEQVMNNDGSVGQVKVYFKPNFIEDNPWEELEIKAGLREPKDK